jgi:hypothetical protein
MNPETEHDVPFSHYIAAAVGYTVVALVVLSMALWAGVWIAHIVAPDVIAGWDAALPLPPVLYTREECAKVWSQGSIDLFGVGDGPLLPSYEFLERRILQSLPQERTLDENHDDPAAE